MTAAPECTVRLANGLKCRGAAKRGQPFCRHHDPASAVPPAQRPLTEHDRFSRHRHWIGINRNLPWFDPADIPMEILQILEALLETGIQGISDREAGRLLRGLLRRIGHVPLQLQDSDLPASEVPGRELPTPPLPSPASASGATPTPALDELEQTNALIASILRAATQPDLPHMQPHLPDFQPNPRRIQSHLPDMRPIANCPSVNRMAPYPSASAAHPATPASHAPQRQLTSNHTHARLSNATTPVNR